MKRLKKLGLAFSLVSFSCGLFCVGVLAERMMRTGLEGSPQHDARLIGLLLWASFSAASGKAVLAQRSPRKDGTLPAAVLLLASSLGITWLGAPSPSAGFAAFLASLLLFPQLCGPVSFLALDGTCIALHAALLFALSRGGLGGLYVIAALPSCLMAWAVRADLQEWERQSALFDQARWAASVFVKTNLRMQDNVDRIAWTTQIEDRLWLSRELHDSIGYTLTAALAQVVASQKIIAAGTEEPESLIRRLHGIEEMIRDTLQDMRRRVSTLREGASLADNGTRRWTRLCRAFADSTGIRVETAIPPELATVSEEVSDGLYRIIQESLTNAYRHGNADLVDVSIGWERQKERILLRISDNGKGASDVTPGNGLNGMRERVNRLHGEFVWRSAPERGFNIGVVVPWRGMEG